MCVGEFFLQFLFFGQKPIITKRTRAHGHDVLKFFDNFGCSFVTAFKLLCLEFPSIEDDNLEDGSFGCWRKISKGKKMIEIKLKPLILKFDDGISN